MTEFFAALERQLPTWMNAEGTEAGIVLSTRARLSRNLRSFPFPHRAGEVELATILGEIKRSLDGSELPGTGNLLELKDLDGRQLKLLQEHGIASHELIADPLSRALSLGENQDRVLHINEENHLHLAALRSGFDPHGALGLALELDQVVEPLIQPAFDAEWGYLSASPAGVGTGLRLSVHLHLPGLVLAGEIEKVCNALSQLQFKVQGLYQKGRSVRGSVFQIANLVSLGQSEEELTQDFEFHVGRLIQHERTARQQLLYRDRIGVEDMAFRNLAVLREARLITSQETVDRLSHVRLGVDLGILPDLDFKSLNALLIRSQSAHLEISTGKELAKRDLAAARAERVREILGAN